MVSVSSRVAFAGDRLRVHDDALAGQVEDERDVAVARADVANGGGDLHLRRSAQLAQARLHEDVLDVDRVDAAHVHLAQEPAEVPPAAGPEPVDGGGAPVRQVRVAAQRRDLDDERVAALADPGEIGLEREVADLAADLLAVQPDLGAVVRALEADLPELELAQHRRLGQRHRELLAVPADRGIVELRVGRVPVVRDRYLGPALEIALRVPALGGADLRVVLAEIPGPAEQLAVELALPDERLAAGALDLQLEARGGGVGCTGAGWPLGGPGVPPGSCALAGVAAAAARQARMTSGKRRTANGGGDAAG